MTAPDSPELQRIGGSLAVIALSMNSIAKSVEAVAGDVAAIRAHLEQPGGAATVRSTATIPVTPMRATETGPPPPAQPQEVRLLPELGGAR